MSNCPLSPEEIIKRIKDIQKILEWSKNKFLQVHGPDFFGTHYIYIDESLQHCIFLFKADNTAHVFIGNPVGAQYWRKYDENVNLEFSKTIPPDVLSYKIYQDYILYKGEMLPPKANTDEPYWGEVVHALENIYDKKIADEWIVEIIKGYYNQ